MHVAFTVQFKQSKIIVRFASVVVLASCYGVRVLYAVSATSIPMSASASARTQRFLKIKKKTFMSVHDVKVYKCHITPHYSSLFLVRSLARSSQIKSDQARSSQIKPRSLIELIGLIWLDLTWSGWSDCFHHWHFSTVHKNFWSIKLKTKSEYVVELLVETDQQILEW